MCICKKNGEYKLDFKKDVKTLLLHDVKNGYQKPLAISPSILLL